MNDLQEAFNIASQSPLAWDDPDLAEVRAAFILAAAPRPVSAPAAPDRSKQEAFTAAYLKLTTGAIGSEGLFDAGYEAGKAVSAPAEADRWQKVGYLFQHDETGREVYVSEFDVENGFEANNPRLNKVGPLFRPVRFTPQPAPVSADLHAASDLPPKPYVWKYRDQFTFDEVQEYARAALAASSVVERKFTQQDMGRFAKHCMDARDERIAASSVAPKADSVGGGMDWPHDHFNQDGSYDTVDFKGIMDAATLAAVAPKVAVPDDVQLVVGTLVSDGNVTISVHLKRNDHTTVLYTKNHALNGETIGVQSLAESDLLAATPQGADEQIGGA